MNTPADVVIWLGERPELVTLLVVIVTGWSASSWWFAQLLLKVRDDVHDARNEAAHAREQASLIQARVERIEALYLRRST